jgi:hypothetical protein
MAIGSTPNRVGKVVPVSIVLAYERGKTHLFYNLCYITSDIFPHNIAAPHTREMDRIHGYGII